MTENELHNRHARHLYGKAFLSFVVKETKHIVRDKRTMLILFGMPVVMMLLFGFAIRTDVKDVKTIVVTSSVDHLTQSIIDRLDASEYFIMTGTAATPAAAERMIRNQQADMAVIFSREFANHRFDGDMGVQFITDAADPNMAQQYVNYAQSIISAAIANARQGQSRQPVNTKMLYNPRMESAYNFVPGIMGMLLLLICAMMTSISIVREKEKGTMEVLLVSPVKPIMIILAKAIPYLLLALAILVTILLMSFYVLGVPLQGSICWIMAVSLLYILLALSLGLLISNLTSSQLAALLMSAMVMLLPTVMLSGMLFPVDSMPAILRWISCIVPARWYISAMRKLMIMGVGIGSVMQEVAVLTLMTTVLLTVSLHRFKTRLE
ncbi:MAG: ABC transporter permease [Prevotella sp.]|nr:ABC transporter permease [Prevotella sp.]